MRYGLCLGIITCNGKPVNHRSLFKIFVNSFLRIFGWQYASDIDPETLEFKSYKLVKCPKLFQLPYLFYNYTERDVVPVRRLW